MEDFIAAAISVKSLNVVQKLMGISKLIFPVSEYRRSESIRIRSQPEQKINKIPRLVIAVLNKPFGLFAKFALSFIKAEIVMCQKPAAQVPDAHFRIGQKSSDKLILSAAGYPVKTVWRKSRSCRRRSFFDNSIFPGDGNIFAQKPPFYLVIPPSGGWDYSFRSGGRYPCR